MTVWKYLKLEIKAKETRQIGSFGFQENLRRANLLLVLFDLYLDINIFYPERGQKQPFFNHLATSTCRRSFWMIPGGDFFFFFIPPVNSAYSSRCLFMYVWPKVATFKLLPRIAPGNSFSFMLEGGNSCVSGGFKTTLFIWDRGYEMVKAKYLGRNVESIALSICTWFLKNQVWKIKFDKLDF